MIPRKFSGQLAEPGAFVFSGASLTPEGDANDHCSQGLSASLSFTAARLASRRRGHRHWQRRAQLGEICFRAISAVSPKNARRAQWKRR